MRLGLGLGLAGNSRYRFSPGTLFSSTAIGIWLDPSDVATMFQDAAGTTAVTTPGQPVGLRLDKSKGLALGSELVANGDFSGGTTGWTPANPSITIAVVDGVGEMTSSAANIYVSQTVNVTSGKTYRVTGLGRAGTAPLLPLVVSGSVTLGAQINSSASMQPISLIFVAGASTASIRFQVQSGAGGTAYFDNISVRELPGNHATQSVAGSRPTYGIEPAGGRRNLLTFSEQFDNAVWTKGGTIAANATAAPDGTMTADLLTELSVFNDQRAFQTTATTATAWTASISWKPNGRTWCYIRINDSTNTQRFVWFNCSGAGAIGTLQAGVSATIVALADGWYRISATIATAFAGSQAIVFGLSTDDGVVAYTGNGTSGAFLWGAQLELGSTATPYQRVTTAFDVTEAGVQTCHYVEYDGIDDGAVTNSIDFTATDKMSVFAGVRKLSDAAAGIFIELSVSAALNNGVFTLATGTANGFTNGYASGARGVIAASNNQVAGVSSLPAPNTSVLSMTHDIAGDLSTMRVNAVAGTSGTGDKGTGTFGNYPLYFGRRGGSTLPFFGRDYGIVVVGKATTAAEITSTESWLAGKTGFYAPIITGVPTIGVS